MKIVVVGLLSLSLIVVAARRSNSIHRPTLAPGGPTVSGPKEETAPDHRRQGSPSDAVSGQERENDVERLIALVEIETDDDQRNERLDKMAASLAPDELRAILDALKEDGRSAAPELNQILLHRWTELDPGASASWAARLPEGEARRSALEHVSVVWAESDPVAAAAWVRGLPEGEDRNAASLILAYEAARTNPILALELAGTLPSTQQRDHLITHAVSQWTASDSATAARWAAMIPDPALRQRLLAAVAVAGADQDGASAATLVAQDLSGTDEQDRAAISVVQRWAQTSPAAAAAWISQFAESAVRDAAAQTLIDLWVLQDPYASGLWARDLPNGSLRDVALTAYVRALGGDEMGAGSEFSQSNSSGQRGAGSSVP